MSKLSLSFLVFALVLGITACGPKAEAPAPEATPEATEEVVEVVEEALVAVAVLQPRADTEVAGRVTFTQTAEGVVVVANVTGVAPGLHGIHLHEKGDCSADDFTSTSPLARPVG